MLHAISMVAVFYDQIAQSPIVVQCPKAVPESWVKWLLPAMVQTVVSLVSIAAGVSIAVWSFRKNHQSEQKQWVRNQNAGHDQWLRDQRRIEWRELLCGLNSVYFPMALTKQLKKPLPIDGSQKLLELSQCFRDRVFIEASTLIEYHTRLTKFALEYVGPSEDEQPSEDARLTVLDKLALLTLEVRDAAKKDLGNL